jgi:hypothetical protein
MTRFAAAALATLLGLALTAPIDAQAAQWKWRDANGRIIYSDRPPPANVPDRAILVRPPGTTPGRGVPPSPSTPSLVPGTPSTAGEAPMAAASAAGKKGADAELEARLKKDADAKAAEAKAAEAKQAAARADNCARAKGQQKLLDDGVRIARTNAKGEREILDDKGRASEQARVRDILNTECK